MTGNLGNVGPDRIISFLFLLCVCAHVCEGTMQAFWIHRLSFIWQIFQKNSKIYTYFKLLSYLRSTLGPLQPHSIFGSIPELIWEDEAHPSHTPTAYWKPINRKSTFLSPPIAAGSRNMQETLPLYLETSQLSVDLSSWKPCIRLLKSSKLAIMVFFTQDI